MLNRTSRRFACCVLSLGLLLGACVDPKGRFDDFVNRIPDAAPTPDAPILLEIPDISGTFFLALASVVNVDAPFLFIVDNTLTPNQDGTATLDTSIQPLSVANRTPVGDPLVFTNVPVSKTGQFELTKADVTFTGAANPVTGNDLFATTVTFFPTIRNADLYCGPVTGMVTVPITIDLAGSTMGAIRVPEGTIGAALPDAVGDCPADISMADAGVPDAMPVADAQVTDSQVNDATP